MSNPLPPFQAHSPESREAAVAVMPKTATIRDIVLNLIRESGPVSDETIAARLNLDPNTARPRRVELQRMGLVERGGTGRTRSGRECALWMAIVRGGDS